MEQEEKTLALCQQLQDKNQLKLSAYRKGEKAFQLLKKEAEKFVACFHEHHPDSEIEVLYRNKQEKSFSLQFGSDVLFLRKTTCQRVRN